MHCDTRSGQKLEHVHRYVTYIYTSCISLGCFFIIDRSGVTSWRFSAGQRQMICDNSAMWHERHHFKIMITHAAYLLIVEFHRFSLHLLAPVDQTTSQFAGSPRVHSAPHPQAEPQQISCWSRRIIDHLSQTTRSLPAYSLESRLTAIKKACSLLTYSPKRQPAHMPTRACTVSGTAGACPILAEETP